jgi:hypothetical protein
VRFMGSLRARVYAVIVVCAVPALVANIIALTSLAALRGDVVDLDRQAALPLAALSDLRAVVGEQQRQVWEYVASAPAGRTAVRSAVTSNDAEVDAAIDTFAALHPDPSSPERRMAAQVEAALATWRTTRTQQVFAAADAGRTADAYAAIAGPLAEATTSLTAPLEQLAGDKRAESNVVVAAA